MRLPPFRDGWLRHLRLDGPRVFLRPIRGKDWRQWSRLRAASRDFLEPWEPTWASDALTRGAYRRQMKAHLHDARQGAGYALHLFRHEDQALLGSIRISNIRRGVAQMATVGYWIGQTFAQQGYMTEGLRLALQFCFADLGLHRVEAACIPDNEASRRLLLKCGFQQEGMARDYLRINGEWRDHLLFGRVRDL